MNTAVIVTVAAAACLGTVIAGLMITTRRHANEPPADRSHRDLPAAADLMSDFEVSRAMGVTVAAHGTPAEACYHPVRGGDRLLQVRVLAGRAGRSVMRTHSRRGKPLSHAGDAAFSGDGWVLGRRGDVVVLLNQFDPGRWRVVGGLPWLLSTALDRVPVPEAPVYR